MVFEAIQGKSFIQSTKYESPGGQIKRIPIMRFPPKRSLYKQSKKNRLFFNEQAQQYHTQ